MNTQTGNKAPLWAQEGMVVVVVKSRHTKPKTANVTKVTQAGWFRVDNDPEYYVYEGVDHWATEQPFAAARSKHNKTKVFPQASEAVLMQWYEDYQKELQEQQDKRNAAQQAREAAEAEELAALKAEFLETLPMRLMDKLSDGSRMVVLVVPTQPEAKPRKGDYEMVMVKLSKSDRWYAEDGPDPRPVRMAMTVANNSTSSFGSFSTTYHANDNEALWEAVRETRRNNW